MYLLYYHDSAADAWLLKALRETGHHVAVANGPDSACHLLLTEPVAVLIVDAVCGLESVLNAAQGAKPAASIVLVPESAVELRPEMIRPDADACLKRPFQLGDLLARLSLIESSLCGGRPGLTLSVRQRTLDVNGVSIELTAQEFRLLDYLLLQAGAVSGARVCRHLWDADEVAGSDALKALIYRLRTKLRRQTGLTLLCSRRGEGYFLNWTQVPGQEATT